MDRIIGNILRTRTSGPLAIQEILLDHRKNLPGRPGEQRIGQCITVSAVIFDLDGVLVESERHWQRAFAQIANEVAGRQGWRLPRPLTAAAMSKYTGGRVNETLRDIFVGLGHSEAAADPFLIEQLTRRVVDQASADFLSDPEPIVSSVEVARSLAAAGMKLGVASSSSIDFIQTVLSYLGLSDSIAAKQSALLLENGKPDGDVYRLTLEHLNEDAADCVAVEDSPVGIRAAADAGLRCIGLYTGNEDNRPSEFEICAVNTRRLTLGDIQAALEATPPS